MSRGYKLRNYCFPTYDIKTLTLDHRERLVRDMRLHSKRVSLAIHSQGMDFTHKSSVIVSGKK